MHMILFLSPPMQVQMVFQIVVIPNNFFCIKTTTNNNTNSLVQLNYKVNFYTLLLPFPLINDADKKNYNFIFLTELWSLWTPQNWRQFHFFTTFLDIPRMHKQHIYSTENKEVILFSNPFFLEWLPFGLVLKDRKIDAS